MDKKENYKPLALLPKGQDDKTRYYVPTSYTLRVKWAFGKVCVTAKARAVHLGLTIKILN